MTAPTPEERARRLVVVDDRGKPAEHAARVVLVCNYCIDSLDDAEFVALAIHVEFASEIRAAEAIARAEGRRDGLEEAAKRLEFRAGNYLLFGYPNDAGAWREAANEVRALAKVSP